MRKLMTLLIFCMLLSVKVLAAEVKVEIFENNINIELTDSVGEYHCTINNSIGEVVFEQRGNSDNIQVQIDNAISGGEYTVRIEYENGENIETVFTYVDKSEMLELFYRLENAQSEDEFIAILDENIWLIEACENYIHYLSSSYNAKVMTVKLVREYNWSSVDGFRKAFDESVFVAVFNECSSWSDIDALIIENIDLLNADKYLSLSDSDRHKICKIMSAERYNTFSNISNAFERAYEYVNYHSEPGKPSGGGGDPSGKFACYITDVDGKEFFDIPTDGTPVKMHVRAVYNNEPSIVYLVGIYDGKGRLKTIKTFESSADTKYFPEFYEFETEYMRDGRIKIFSFNNIHDLIPLYENVIFGFGNSAVPESETETEGIVAIKGTVDEITPDYFVIKCSEKRVFGYWNGIDSGEEIKVKGQYVIDYQDEETVYNLSFTDGEYSLHSINSADELISFSFSEISEYNEKSLCIGNRQLTFSDNCKMCLFSGQKSELIHDIGEIAEQGEYFTAEIKDGQIISLCALEYIFGEVEACGGGKIIIGNTSLENNFILASDVQIGDIVMLYYGKVLYVEKADGINGIFNFKETYIPEEELYFRELWVEINNEKYPIKKSVNFIDNVVDGEECIVYFEPGGHFVKCIDSNINSYNRDIIIGIDKAAIITLNGRIELTDEVFFNGVIETTDMIFHKLEDELAYGNVYPIYYKKVGERLKIDSIEIICDTKGVYSKFTNSIGGYILSEDTEVIVVTADGYEYAVEDVLKDGYFYRFSVCMGKNHTPVFILIDSPGGEVFTEYQNMIVSYVSQDYEIFGYVDGEYTCVECETINKYPYPGDVLRVAYRDGTAITADILFSPIQCNTDYKKGDIVFAKVRDIKNNIISLYDEAFLVSDSTDIYIYDEDSRSVVPADFEDIFFGYEFSENNDRIIVWKNSDNTVKSLLIFKN